MKSTTAAILAIIASVAASAAISGHADFHIHHSKTKSPLHISIPDIEVGTTTGTVNTNSRQKITDSVSVSSIHTSPSIVTVTSTITQAVISTMTLSPTSTSKITREESTVTLPLASKSKTTSVTSAVTLSATSTPIPTPSGSHIFRGNKRRGLVSPELPPLLLPRRQPSPESETFVSDPAARNLQWKYSPPMEVFQAVRLHLRL
ncbi:hypothetical protein B7494_g7431 [Chlorociboria aeruginascens]|nr:hypothetical protein B7494_g7431 [Chlorociboria aeruginascens]